MGDGTVKDYAAYSYWLETCGDDLTPRPPLHGTIEVDVAILGAGFTGLWTAYYLLEREPSLRIAIVEKEIAGFGASGRNGGGISNRFPVSLTRIDGLYGRQAALDFQHALDGMVDEIGRVTDAEGIEMDFTRGGYLRLARGPHQLQAIERERKAFEKFGFGDRAIQLDAQQTAERVAVSGVVGSIFTSNSGKLHPGKFVRGLARAVERKGATIYEGTAVTDFTTGAYPALHTERGHVRAKTIVLAGEAYLSKLPKVGRKVMPVYSLISATEPLSDAEWQEIGWEAREGLSSANMMVNYLTRTADGRILFGGRGAPYQFGSSIKDAYDRDDATHRMLQDSVRDWFPMLKDVKFTHSWGGPLGWPRDYVPTLGYDAKEGLAAAYGYTGTGVAPSNLFGRALADLITGVESDVTQLPFINRKSRKWEPEPFRFLGVRFVQRGFQKLDEKAEASGIAPDGTSLVERLTRH